MISKLIVGGIYSLLIFISCFLVAGTNQPSPNPISKISSPSLDSLRGKDVKILQEIEKKCKNYELSRTEK
jgi:hypothetical protein